MSTLSVFIIPLLTFWVGEQFAFAISQLIALSKTFTHRKTRFRFVFLKLLILGNDKRVYVQETRLT